MIKMTIPRTDFLYPTATMAVTINHKIDMIRYIATISQGSLKYLPKSFGWGSMKIFAILFFCQL